MTPVARPPFDATDESLRDSPQGDALFDFSFVDVPVRGALVHLRDTWARVVQEHRYPQHVAQLLGEMLSGAALLGHLVKDTDVALQTRGDGPVRLVMAESLQRTSLRGIARLRDDVARDDAQPTLMTPPASAFVDAEVAPIETLLGKGELAITLRPTQGELYQGVVPLEGASLSGCLEHYFATSEQLATRVWLTAADGAAAGLLLQRVPTPPEQSEMSETIADAAWLELTTLASTLTARELRDMPVDALLLNLFHEHRIRLRDPQALAFRCTCSRERTEGVLRMLGKDEVDSVLAERGEVDMQCQFCGTRYLFQKDDVRDFWSG